MNLVNFVKILYLGNENRRIINFLEQNNIVIIRNDRINNIEEIKDIDFIVSFGYRYLIKKEIVNKFYNRAINLHISYLPWNKGADPNLWSFLDDTPKGGSIHFIDHELDEGDILCQYKIEYSDNDTLRTTYEMLIKKMEDLFIKYWDKIVTGKIIGIQQTDIGTYHKMADKKKYEYLLIDGWDTPVKDILGKAKVVE